jgi:tripartite-type tricarboxylate transporter receptor subunit TctC
MPARTPLEIVRKANADTVAALAYPETKARLEQLGIVVIGSSSEGLAAHLRSEMEKWGPIIREAGIKPGD